MTSSLQGSELIDCAKANGSKGIEVASQRCGYGEDLDTFERELRKAGEHIGIKIEGFQDLITERRDDERVKGEVISPDSQSQL